MARLSYAAEYIREMHPQFRQWPNLTVYYMFCTYNKEFRTIFLNGALPGRPTRDRALRADNCTPVHLAAYRITALRLASSTVQATRTKDAGERLQEQCLARY